MENYMNLIMKQYYRKIKNVEKEKAISYDYISEKSIINLIENRNKEETEK